MIIVEVALVIAMMSALTYRMRSKMRGLPVRGLGLRIMALPFTHRTITAVFVVLLVIGSVSLAGLVSSLATGSINSAAASVNFIVLLSSFYFMARILRNLTLRQRGALL